MATKEQQLQLIDGAIARLEEKGSLTSAELQDYKDYIVLREQISAGSEAEGRLLFFKFFMRLCTGVATHEIIDHLKKYLE